MEPEFASMASNRKQVLEEDAYVEALDAIIERDFFPDLPKLKYQTMWLDALATKNAALIAQVRQYIANDQQKRPQTKTSSRSQQSLTGGSKRKRADDEGASAWDVPTPPRTSSDIDEPTEDDATVDDAGEAPSKATATMTLNHFLATHTSEDNAAFEELQEKAVAEHKKKYHWAFDDDHANTRLLLLPDGTKMTQERRLLMDKACDTKLALEDARPVAPDTWTFRARNQLLFPPDLETSRAICKLEATTTGDVLLLENGTPPAPDRALTKSLRTGAVAKKPMETVYANSRFSSAFLASQELPPDIAPAAPLDLVEMTPLIVPGDGNGSPLMTWGDIAATPMILPSETPARTWCSPRAERALIHAPVDRPVFEIKDKSKREKLALAMDAKNKQRMKAKKTPTPFRSTPGRGKATPTPLLSVFRAGAFSELRASYATPLRSSSKNNPPKK
ncbi:hypothetical protein SPRG_14731 [Saprolegnia parasitica CBS 223.65]|uniref:Uncharacterized protein n=1 Tax=Saprolegnia parasitica (strain CBS 223.65) TaxID=695850 RepID=A0A067BNR8_SAPPC|nr:hypothetical protein SPRG_14731 [Saprolegnia parasitica CBS 223.65]KDO19888.1 hypothetical protein SPRG_14731 [Saprolegnia parasitica CBS 223.65]|eukprot:XP_012209390.1 hypothetical protein SPRG_14731 [Saprolegnia parasitica CBS 223.65]